MLQFDVTHALPFLPKNWLSSRLDGLTEARNLLERGNGLGGEFTGWVNLPAQFDQREMQRLLHTARIIQSQSEVLVVIGIGGSYLGARAMLELLTSPNYNLLCKKTPQIFFTGNTLSPDAMTELLDYVREKDFSVNVVSKSGNTTEPHLHFQLQQGKSFYTSPGLPIPFVDLRIAPAPNYHHFDDRGLAERTPAPGLPYIQLGQRVSNLSG